MTLFATIFGKYWINLRFITDGRLRVAKESCANEQTNSGKLYFTIHFFSIER